MKITRDEKFEPILFTIETKEEYLIFRNIIGKAGSDCLPNSKTYNFCDEINEMLNRFEREP